MTHEQQSGARTVGFIGLGRMGGRMAMNLARAGFSLTVYDRVREHALSLAEAGATVASSLAEVASRSEVVITMVTDSAAVEAIVLGDSGLLFSLRPGAVLIDMSTIDPRVSRKVARAVRARGAHMLDAPVSGSTALAEQGQLSIIVGGDQRVCESVRHVLLKIGSRITHAGPNGAGASLKLAVNVVGGLTMQALAESIVLAERAGVSPAVTVDVLSNSALASPFLKYKAAQLLQPLAPAAFTTAMMQKDFTLALQMASDVGVPLPATATANEVITMARGLGLGEHDFAAVADVIRTLSGPARSTKADDVNE
jgi:3-hydroxyisobutyrate dehydrogenase-like beta-hydroxyacid dehydrogenase